MAREGRVPIDRLTDEHKLMPFAPTDARRTRVVEVVIGGRIREVIVPPPSDARVGEVIASAIDGEVVFLLCRHDRPPGEPLGTGGLLVVAVPHRDGRFRAA